MLLLLACHPVLKEDTAKALSPRDECNPGCISVQGPEIERVSAVDQELAFTVSEEGICFDWLPVGTYVLTLETAHDQLKVPVDVRPFGYDLGRIRESGPAEAPTVVLSHPQSPMLTPAPGSWYQYQVSTPSVAGNTLAFAGADNYEGGSSNNPYRIGTLQLNGLIPAAPPGDPLPVSDWDAATQNDPWLLEREDGLVMYYQGRASMDGIPTIGRVFSPDGLTWTQDPQNPLYTNEAEGGASHPTVVEWEDGLVELWVASIGGPDLAISTDGGSSFQPYCQNPVVHRPPEGEIKAPQVQWIDGQYWMNFTVGEKQDFWIGQATSLDGIRWTEGPHLLDPGDSDWNNLAVTNAQLDLSRNAWIYSANGDAESGIAWAVHP